MIAKLVSIKPVEVLRGFQKPSTCFCVCFSDAHLASVNLIKPQRFKQDFAFVFADGSVGVDIVY